MNAINLTVNGSKKLLQYPADWSEVTVAQYRQLQGMDTDQHTLRNRAQIMSIMLGIDLDLVYQFSPKDFNDIESSMAWMSTPMEVEEGIDHVEIDGEEYYFFSDFKLFGVGEMISIEVLIEKSNNNLLAVYNELLCIFLRKKDERGKLEIFRNDMMERAKLFDRVPIGKVNSMMVFFSATGAASA